MKAPQCPRERRHVASTRTGASLHHSKAMLAPSVTGARRGCFVIETPGPSLHRLHKKCTDAPCAALYPTLALTAI